MEIAWTVGPALIVVAIAIPTIQAVFRTQTPPAAEEDALVVEVVGHQYWWELRYPELGVTTANEMHMPVGRPITLKMSSVDVIHSFWVPQLGGKRDLNPFRRVPEGGEARYTWLYFTINEGGTFLGQCAEFCGEAHSLMRTRMVAESEALAPVLVPVLLVLSTAKFAPVVMFFMHLKSDTKVFSVLFLAGLALEVFVVVMMIILYQFLPRFDIVGG